MPRHRVYEDKSYCPRCGILMDRAMNRRFSICDDCIVERYKERLKYFREVKKIKMKKD